MCSQDLPSSFQDYLLCNEPRSVSCLKIKTFSLPLQSSHKKPHKNITLYIVIMTIGHLDYTTLLLIIRTVYLNFYSPVILVKPKQDRLLTNYVVNIIH